MHRHKRPPGGGIAPMSHRFGRGSVPMRVLLPATIVTLFVGGGWTLRNQLAADRQGDWVRVTRGDLVTGIEVAGKLASAGGGRLRPPPGGVYFGFLNSPIETGGVRGALAHATLRFSTNRH